jgi:uncharacterized coiled-coil DUF342 family protein
MITLTREEAQQVLDALKHLCLHSRAIAGYDGEKVQPPIDMLKAKLKQPENEFNPDWDELEACKECLREYMAEIKKLKKEWQSLTTAETKALWNATKKPAEFAEMLQAKLREKNG